MMDDVEKAADDHADGTTLRIAGLPLAPGRRQRLGDQLYGQILDNLIEGRLKTGDRLPTEKAICEMFGVSRPIVREALLRLRADGLIQSRQGAGTFVVNQPTARLKTFTATDDLAGYLRCLEVRMSLEGAAARLAAERRTPAQLARIERTHATWREEIERSAVSPESDLAFHEAIAEATGNEYFHTTQLGLNGATLGFMRVSLGLTRTGSLQRARQVLEEHVRIFEAIRAQDGELAEVSMRFHIGQARRRVIDRSRDV
jgi:GntR family transcriptional repressor for pyruvate dehydrogenase complex